MKKARILILESEAIIAESLSELLKTKGYIVQIAKTAERAIQLAKQKPPHLLIVEPHLGGKMDGVVAVNAILVFNPHAEIIFATAWDAGIAPKFSMKKPCEVVSKPYDEDELLVFVHKCLERVPF